jgi:hypothetical protein
MQVLPGVVIDLKAIAQIAFLILSVALILKIRIDAVKR